jgi:hypothetical protein
MGKEDGDGMNQPARPCVRAFRGGSWLVAPRVAGRIAASVADRSTGCSTWASASAVPLPGKAG